MQVENSIRIMFTQDELKEALLGEMEFRLNDCVVESDEWTRRNKIIEHIRKSFCVMEWADDTFCLSADGIASVEDF